MRRAIRRVSTAWSVTDAMRRRDASWMPMGGYELRAKVEVDGAIWTACFKVHVVAQLDERANDWAGVYFQATVTLWPPKVGDGGERGPKALGRFRNAKANLASLGYVGKWTDTEAFGRWGNFEKPLSTLVDVKREARTLERLARAPGVIFEATGGDGSPARAHAKGAP